jgi:transketolase
MEGTIYAQCERAAEKMRCDIIKMTYSAGIQGAHIGGSLSLVEILSALYVGGILKYDLKNPGWDGRDRLILSKGHGAMALYAALNEIGVIPEDDLWTYKSNDTYIALHPAQDASKGLEFSSGSLGQGLSLGIGTALALLRKNNAQSRMFVILGDGECDEGSVWEAAACAAHYGLNRIVAIIDCNALQNDGFTNDILRMEDMSYKWSSFGWDSVTVDGHNMQALYEVLSVISDKPRAVIAKTVKGKGVSFMENNFRWHNARLSKIQYEQAMSEQGVNAC